MGQTQSCFICMVNTFSKINNIPYKNKSHLSEVETSSWKQNLIIECSQYAKQYLFANEILQIIDNFNLMPQTKIQLHLQMSIIKQFKKEKKKKGEYQIHQIENVLNESEILEEQLNLASENTLKSETQNDISSFISIVFQEKYQSKKWIMLEPEKQQLINAQLEFYIEFVKEYEKIVKKTEDFQILHQIFISCYKKQYDTMDSQQLILMIQTFVRIIQQCQQIYYNFGNIKKTYLPYSSLITNESLMNLVVNQIMNLKDIYYLLYTKVQEEKVKDIEVMKNIMKNESDIVPQECGVSSFYCLNQLTENLFEQSSFEKIKKSLNLDQPYLKSIEQLKKLKVKKSPLSKLKVIILSQKQIMSSIKTFFKGCKRKYDQLIDSDDILGIQKYTLIKSQLDDIDVHIYIIEQLATTQLLQDSCGYYLVTLKAASELLKQNQLK